MSETSQDSRPENFNREPILVKTWAAVGKALLPTVFSGRVSEIENKRAASYLLMSVGSAAEMGALASFLYGLPPEVSGLFYAGGRALSLIGEKIGLPENRDRTNIRKERLPVKAFAGIGKALLPSIISSRKDIYHPRLRRIINIAKATEIASAFMIPINPALAVATYGASRLAALIAESTDQKKRTKEKRKSLWT